MPRNPRKISNKSKHIFSNRSNQSPVSPKKQLRNTNKYVKHHKLNLKSNHDFNEKWVQERIAGDSSILGLGELILKDKERNQPGAGRLDLLFQDPDSNLRYEVEVQLGKTDESHIIRTIEYWDLERKRYPQYDHVAVLVAEDITSRFLNIISLFNGFLPLVAIQLNAITIGEHISLIFTTVLDQRLGFALDEEDEQEVVDRSYWEKRGSKISVNEADEVLKLLKGLDQELELKYNKFYIGVAKGNKPLNFVIFRPKKTSLRVEPKLQKNAEIEELLEAAGLEVFEYDSRNQRYRIRLSKDETRKHKKALKKILEQAYRDFNGYSTEA